ncbi:MAG: MerR family transcriptional regulator [Propionibacteriales bacterium]|nr:MerR family transcriptional regulator [Propionibacteriales bacterium]
MGRSTLSAQKAEMTIDQLAAAVEMTVRNVRAYASRGLIPPPRLVGRTGYYGEEHASRLRLVRDLIDRGYTLGAVEKALLSHAAVPAVHALDLLGTLANPLGQVEEPEQISRADLAGLAGVEQDEELLRRLADLGLVEQLDDGDLLMTRPSLVRAGAKAMELGLDQESVLGMLPVLSEHLNLVAKMFVDEFRARIWHPFTEAGMPDDQWPEMLQRIQAVLPVAAQAVVSVFRDELARVIDEALGEELHLLADGSTDSA